MTAPPPAGNGAVQSPTDRWRAAASELPVMTTPGADTAERLCLLVHYCIDWSGWIGEPRHRQRYWDYTLPQRLRAATYRADSLYTWWSTVADALGVVPAHADRRAEITQLLAAPPGPVLAVLRDALPAILLRVRYITERVAAERKTV